MLQRHRFLLMPLGLLALALPAQAVPADPLDAQAPVPKAEAPRALAGYRRLAEPEALPWREANETVRQVGGWRVYAREAAASAPAPQQSGTPKP